MTKRKSPLRLLKQLHKELAALPAEFERDPSDETARRLDKFIERTLRKIDAVQAEVRNINDTARTVRFAICEAQTAVWNKELEKQQEAWRLKREAKQRDANPS